MIDVQIQNRVMNITIRNNSDALVELVALNSGDLKELLSYMNYQVTSVNVKPFETINETAGHSMMQTYISQSTSTYTGVDIKDKKHDKKVIALQYDSDKEIAPKVIAKGKGLVAEEIIEAAKKHEIPVQEDLTLIELLSKLEINQQIPEELYEAVAEIFAFIYKLEKMYRLVRGQTLF